MKKSIFVAFVLGILVAIFWLQKPSYQGRQLRSCSDNFASRKPTWEIKDKDGHVTASGWDSKDDPDFRWHLYIECSKDELQKIGVDPTPDKGESPHEVIDYDRNGVKTLYLRKDLYLKNRAVLESMRPTKWFYWQKD